MKRYALLVVTGLLFVAFSAMAQVKGSSTAVKTNARTLAWKGVMTKEFFVGYPEKFLNFEGATYQPNTNQLGIPYYFEKVSLPAGNNNFTVSLSNVVTQPLSPEEAAVIPQNIELPSTLTPEPFVALSRQKYVASFSMPALIKTTSGRIEKLVSFTVNFDYSNTTTNAKTAKSAFVTNSVLANGNWYKMAIVNEGVYKITGTYLNQLGMGNNLPSAFIRLYGNGGGRLPELNSVARVDDLGEVAVEMNDGGDGVFNDNDFLLFYGKSQHRWVLRNNGIFENVNNDYADTTYYFITLGGEVGKRIASQPSTNNPANYTTTTFSDYALQEVDRINIANSGREFYGELFDVVNEYDFNLTIPNIVTTDTAKFRIKTAANCSGTGVNMFSCKINNTNMGNISYTGATSPYIIAITTLRNYTITNPTTGSFNINLTKINSQYTGWLDYIEVNARRNLTYNGGAMFFRDARSVAPNRVTKFTLGNSNGVKVWDVTDHQNVANQQLSNGEFTLETPTLREFVAFSGTDFAQPIAQGQVANQNLHAMAVVDYVIFAPPVFTSQANQLAQFHQGKGLSVAVINPALVYNEFSSGAQDILGLRDFLRMLYNRGSQQGTTLKYCLLFGDGSYDNKFREPNNTNFLPTWESTESLNLLSSFTSDDYYGFLDDTEGGFDTQGTDALDIGIGRFVCRNQEEADICVQKVFDYKSTNNLREWRNIVSLVADDQDGDTHVQQTEAVDNIIQTDYKTANTEKIYFDSFLQESTVSGQEFPSATDAINQRVNRGALIMNYAGHGGEAGWAHEKVLAVNDIDSWTNQYNLVCFMTATCEFCRFDNPKRVSAGEDVLIKPNGGIGLFTTTRVVFASANLALNVDFTNLMTDMFNAPQMETMGDLYRLTKEEQAGDSNSWRFMLIGDPGLRLNYPVHRVVTTTINNKPANTANDTIQALETVTLAGFVTDRVSNQKLTNYNGTLYITVYDKPTNLQTLGQDQDSQVINYKVRRSIIYKGKVSVTNGDWAATFKVPKDIVYTFGQGKISYYAENGEVDNDAGGFYDAFTIGGQDTTAVCDNVGPTIRLYMNDLNFVNGGTTNETPTLVALIADSTGINTTGNGIGHDITGILNNQTNNPIILNDFYEADLNSFVSGRVDYRLDKLPLGPNTIAVKAWDNCNNSAEARLDFIVSSSADMALNHVLNYPNPFTTNTTFMFEHNRPGVALDVQLQVFTISGKLVKTINSSVNSPGFRNADLTWDGLDDYGDRIGRGVYVYRLKITDPDGKKAEKFEKLVILR